MRPIGWVKQLKRVGIYNPSHAFFGKTYPIPKVPKEAETL